MYAFVFYLKVFLDDFFKPAEIVVCQGPIISCKIHKEILGGTFPCAKVRVKLRSSVKVFLLCARKDNQVLLNKTKQNN